MYSDSELRVHRRLEPGEPGGTKASASVPELSLVLDDRDTQLDHVGVFLFSA
jgi:hypothetical protein